MQLSIAELPRRDSLCSPALIAALLSLFLHLDTPLSAQTIIRSLELHGHSALTAREILRTIVSQPGGVLSIHQLQHDLENVLNVYHQNGYFFARLWVDSLGYSEDSVWVDVHIGIDEGGQARIGDIKIEGNTLFTVDDILRLFDTRKGRVFSPTILERDIDNLLRQYEQQGYPFAKATIADVSPLQTSQSVELSIEIHIDEGVLVQIQEIQVEGNKETKPHVVAREMRIRMGEVYNHEKVLAIRQRLNRLNIFASVQEPELYVTPQGGGILIRVQEGRTNTFDGVAGYVPAGVGERGIVTGMVSVGMRNLFGTGRRFAIRWQREDQHSQELALRYVEPWVLSYPVNVGGSFFQRQQDTTYVRRMIELKTEVMVTDAITAAGVYGHENVIPSQSTTPPAVFHSSTITTGMEIQYDSRDDLLSPTSGVLYRSDYRIGRKKIFGLPVGSRLKSRLTIQRLSLDLEAFFEIFPRQVFAPSLHGRELRSDVIELGDLYRFGGANTLRGYRESQFLGSRMIWSNLEYRFLLARRSFFLGFFDTGYYFRPGEEARQIPSAEGLKYGYGIGVRVETGLGNIGVSFALGEGDSFSQGKIHVGLINEF